jgi:hypothetical protein
MALLRIQHSVPMFDAWKRAFDSDPLDRKGSGVRRYLIHRSVSDPNFVMIDLELGTVGEAQAFLEKLRGLWNGPGKAVMRNPEAWILETIQATEP